MTENANQEVLVDFEIVTPKAAHTKEK